MLVKIHTSEGKMVVAICDKELVGEKFEEAGKQLDLSTDFYNGEEMPIIEIEDLIRNANMLNLVGEKSISFGIKEEIIEESNVIKIAGIPHAEVLIEDES